MPANTTVAAMDTSESNDQGDAVDGPGGSGMTSEAKASGPKAPGTPGPHEMLRHAIQSFDEGTPEFQAANMFLRYMEGSGLLPPCPEGQVSKKVM